MFKPCVGDKVRLTGRFLRSTGQYTGEDAHRVWSVLSVDARHGSCFVVVDQEREPDQLKAWTPEELAAEPMLKWRRINAANLQHAADPDHT